MKSEKLMTWTIVLWIALGAVCPSTISAFVHSIEYVKYGFCPSMAIDSQGHIHLSYYSGNILDYGRWDGISWSFEDVELDSTSHRGQNSAMFLDAEQRPHIVYTGRISGTMSYQFMHAAKQDGTWQLTEVDVVDNGIDQTSAGITTSGRIWASWAAFPYLFEPYHELRYSHFDGDSWTTGLIDNENYSGRNNSLSIDPITQYPGVTYSVTIENYGDKLKYAWWNGMSWIKETIDSGCFLPAPYNSMDFDSVGIVRVTYVDEDNNLKYASRVNGVWDVSIIDTGALWRSPVKLKMDQGDNPHIVYKKVGEFGLGFRLMYATFDQSNTWRFASIIESPNSVPPIRGFDLALDPASNVHIIFVDEAGPSGRGLYHVVVELSIYYVDADAPPGGDGSDWAKAFNSLQDALAVAQPGDKICVAQGVYKPAEYMPPPPPPPPPGGSGGEPVIFAAIDRETTFQLKNCVVIKGGYAGLGQPDPNARDIDVYKTILSGDLLGNDGPDFANNGENSFHVVTGSDCDETAVLDGFTITAGNANGSNPEDRGAGMTNDSGGPTLTNCTFVRNWAHYAAGIANKNGSNPTLTNCTFRDNLVVASGGAVYNWNHSNSTLTNCTFSGNSAPDGAAMFIYNSRPSLTNCLFGGNSSQHNGGALYLRLSSPTVTNCMFTGNSANRDGGGMFNESASPVLTSCTFTGNSAIYDGGAICNRESSPMVNNCKFNGNSANHGGGISNWPGSPNITNCTFNGNSAELGGAVFNWESSPNLTNCLFSINSARELGGAVGNFNGSSPSLANCTFSGNSAYGGGAIFNVDSLSKLTNCILWGDSPQEVYNSGYGGWSLITYSDIQGGWPGEGNIDTDPCFVQTPYFSLVSYWKLDEGSGTTAYDSIGFNNGNVYGAQWTTGQVDSALNFDGSGDFVSVPHDASLNITGDITISAWIYLAKGGKYQAIVTKCVGAGPRNNPFDFRTNTGAEPQLAFVRADALGHERVYSRTRISLGEWHHVLVRVENKVPDFYIDGVDAGKWADNPFTKTPTGNIYPLLIGARDDGLYFNGKIDEIALYDRALSAEEIKQLYEWPDYHLPPDSPCINAGDPDYVAEPNETDLDGKPRVIEGRIDMGAYEFNHVPVADAGSDRVIEAQAPWGAAATLDASGSSDTDSTPGTNDDIVYFDWYEVDPCDPNADILFGSGEIIDCNLTFGEHIISLEVTDRAGAFDVDEVTIVVQDTTPPVFTNIPQDLTVECDGSYNASELNAWLAGAAAVDKCGDVTITNDFVGLLKECGATGSATVTWTAEDESGNKAATMATFTIVDTMPPVVNCPPDVTLECPADMSVEANGSATAGDTCSSVTISHSDVWQPACGNTGILTRTWTATDECGNSSTCVQTITVVDTTPPEFEFSVTPAVLWPPTHKMVEITPSWTVSDKCDATPDVSLIDIVMNEGNNTKGDGHTEDDIQIGDDGSIYLRSERSGTGSDRIYTVTYRAVDDCGNATVRSATVTVPHDQR